MPDDQARWPEAAQIILRTALSFTMPSSKVQDEVTLSVIGDLLRRYGHGLFEPFNTLEVVYRSKSLDKLLYPEHYDDGQVIEEVKIVRDHMVPIAELAIFVLDNVRANPGRYLVTPKGIEALGSLIKPFLRIAEILETEDDTLTTWGFRERMPNDLWKSGCDSIGTRYAHTWIEMVQIGTGRNFSARRYTAQRGPGAKEIWVLRREQR